MAKLDRALDVRPDRLDLRDRPYTPRLVGLPARYPDPRAIASDLAAYTADGMILDQGQEGACTGFGLAAVINYLRWSEARRVGESRPDKVSPRMLYHLARFYDEWPGEDYDGSSCRGAMKGWHRHGVCSEDIWPYLDPSGAPQFVSPSAGWETDASHRPVGAYYRIDKASVVDMQAALVEVGAVYVSATVHDGWAPQALTETSPEGIRMIAPLRDPASVGGHAFAIVGYTFDGFIVQNSWGPAWGTQGFAIVRYDDWVEHGMDAWVSSMGAAVHVQQRAVSLSAIAQGPAGLWGINRNPAPRTYAYPRYKPLDEKGAYLHSVVMGNNGIVLQRLYETENALASLERVLVTEPLDWEREPAHAAVLGAGRPLKVMLYAHGGLNGEDKSVRRVRVLAPYFRENGVYPIFFTWKTGVRETIEGIVRDHLDKLIPREAAGLWDRVKDTAQQAKDRLIESACQELHIKSIWDQMKQNAAAAAGSADDRPTLGLTVKHLIELRRRLRAERGRELELHLVGHSAGSILLGYLLDLLGKPEWTGAERLPVTTCTLYAPACTVKFALDHYKPAIDAGLLKKSGTTFEILADDVELGDSVGPYGKSLLYLVSRGLEDYHKMPLLGFERAWGGQPAGWGNATLQDQVTRWQTFWADGPGAVRRDTTKAAHDGVKSFAWAHGAFDNDAGVVGATIERITGRPLVARIEDLQGY